MSEIAMLDGMGRKRRKGRRRHARPQPYIGSLGADEGGGNTMVLVLLAAAAAVGAFFYFKKKADAAAVTPSNALDYLKATRGRLPARLPSGKVADVKADTAGQLRKLSDGVLKELYAAAMAGQGYSDESAAEIAKNKDAIIAEYTRRFAVAA